MCPADSQATAVTCPLCQSAASMLADAFPGYQEGGRYQVFECVYCDIQFVHPMAVHNQLYEAIYRHADHLPGYHRYSSYRAEIATQPNPLGWLSAQEPAFWFIQSELAKLPREARILEVGSGLGYLTYALRSAGYHCIGIDISENAIAEARSAFGDFYLHKDLRVIADEEPGSFDAVIMTEVIEHVPHPTDFLSLAARLLKTTGIALVTTPNKSAARAGTCWQTESPPVHLWWFSETGMRRLAQDVGLMIRLCDFSPRYRKLARAPAASPGETPHPWLSASGEVTGAASEWLINRRKNEATSIKLKRYLGAVWPYLQVGRRIKSDYPIVLQRTDTMGVVLSKGH